MPFAHGSKAVVYLNGTNVSSFLRSVSVARSVDTAETTVLGLTAKTYIPGLTDGTISAEGFFDGAAAAIDAVISTAIGDAPDSNWLVLPAGDGLGNKAYGAAAIDTSYEISEPVDDVGTITIEAQANGGKDPLQVYHPHGAETTTGNDTSIDGTAQTTNGGVAYLEVTAASGSSSPTLIVKVQDSADNSAFADILTFTTVAQASAPTSLRAAITGTVRRYTRTTRTIAGTTPSFSYIAAFGRR